MIEVVEGLLERLRVSFIQPLVLGRALQLGERTAEFSAREALAGCPVVRDAPFEGPVPDESPGVREALELKPLTSGWVEPVPVAPLDDGHVAMISKRTDVRKC